MIGMQKLSEAEQSSVEVKQAALVTGKAAKSTKLWFLLKQSMSRFQRAVDLARLMERCLCRVRAGETPRQRAFSPVSR